MSSPREEITVAQENFLVLANELAKHEEEIRDSINAVKRRLHRTLRTIAGPMLETMLETMLESREMTEKFLNDPDPKLRWLAITLLRDHWKPSEEFIKWCKKIAVADQDADVRACALSCVSVFYMGSNDTETGEFVAKRVLDKTENSLTRATAYNCLFQLRDVPLNEWPSLRFHFPEDVDWQFVHSFLKSNKE